MVIHMDKVMKLIGHFNSEIRHESEKNENYVNECNSNNI